MALFHWSVQVLSRKGARTTVAAAAYRAAERLVERSTGKVHDYRAKHGVVHEEILCPRQTPAHLRDREGLWNAVEAAETRKDAQLAREIVLALPHELGLAENITLLRRYVAERFVSHGMIADLAVHLPVTGEDHRNIHAHVMLTLRKVDGDGFYGKKTREWNMMFWNALPQQREAWAAYVNAGLKAANKQERVDHRSFADRLVEAKRRGDRVAAALVERQPQRHMGAKAIRLAREGRASPRVTANAKVVLENFEKAGRHVMGSRDAEAPAMRHAIEAVSKLLSGGGDEPIITVTGMDVMLSLYRSGLVSREALAASLESLAAERALEQAQRAATSFYRLIRVRRHQAWALRREQKREAPAAFHQDSSGDEAKMTLPKELRPSRDWKPLMRLPQELRTSTVRRAMVISDHDPEPPPQPPDQHMFADEDRAV